MSFDLFFLSDFGTLQSFSVLLDLDAILNMSDQIRATTHNSLVGKIEPTSKHYLSGGGKCRKMRCLKKA